VDPTKEVEAFKEAVRCGFMTLQDVVSQSGADIEEIFDQREKEIGLAAEAGLVLDTDPANEIKAEPEPDPPAEAPDEDEEDDEIGENRAWAAALNSLESALADSSLSNARTAATLQETCSGLRHAIAASNENTAARISEEAKRSRADVAETRKAIESSERAISRASDLVAWSQKASQDLRSEVRDGFASVTAVSVKQSAEIASLRDTQLRAAAIDQSNIATLPGEGSANSSPDKELREKVAMHSGNAPAIVAGTSK
jgi:hypothetical protein